MESGNPPAKKNFFKSRTTNSTIPVGLGKLPPQALELEQAVLGALMIEKDALTIVLEILKADSFYHEKHQKIYAAVLELYDKLEPIDILTVTQKLRSKGELEFVGGAYYITELTTRINSAANIETHARIVSEHAIKRELISISSEIQREAFEDSSDAFELLDRTEQKLYQVSESNIRKNFSDMRTILRTAIEELQTRKNHENKLTGVPSGFTDLDRLTNGWQRDDLVIIAARPAMGKTAFVVSAMRNAAVEFKKPVAIFSLEMSAVQLVNRLISSEAELDSEKIKKGNLEEFEWTQLHHKIRNLETSPIFIDDTPALSIRELRTKARRLKAKHDIQMIIIDYLQLMSGDSGTKGGPGNREQEISAISRALKGLAKELSIPVIALSQLSRAVETRGGDKRPQLSDLRESGAIEQDADMVMFLYRPEYYGITEDETGMPTTGVGEVIVAKHRSGGLDTVKLRFIGKFTKFCDLNRGFNSFEESSSIPTSFDTGGGFGNTFSSKLNDLRPPKNSGPDDEDDIVPF